MALPIFLAWVWAIGDVLLSRSDVGYSWCALAVSPWRYVALLQSASLIGQLGLTALCVWFAARLALWLSQPDETLSVDNRGYWRAPPGGGAAAPRQWMWASARAR